jgi:putative ABC transport system substrate-binding protein
MKRREFIAGLGSAAAWPLAASAQQPTTPTVGFLSPSSPDVSAGNVAAVRRGLNDAGFVEGRNVVIDFRWAEDHYDRLPTLAADLVRRQVAVIIANGLTAGLRAKAATATIPIVFWAGSDPVTAGLVASLNRPGGNATGVAGFNDSLITKQLEILHDLVPNAAVVGMLVNPSAASAEVQARVVQAAGRTLGMQTRILNVENQEQFDSVFSRAVREGIGAVLVPQSTLFLYGRARLLAVAALHAMPAIYCPSSKFLRQRAA